MTSNRCATLVLWSALASALLFGVACGGGEEERSTPTPTPLARSESAMPDTSTDSTAAPRAPAATDRSAAATPGGSPGEQLRKRIDLPDSFPADAPVYPDTAPSQYVELGGGRLSLTFGTPDPPDEVMEYMLAELPRRRWDVVAQNDLETGKILQATKGDRLFSMLLSRVDQGKPGEITMIAISVDP